MRLRMWMYDLAREQCPKLDHLRTLCRLTRDAGYDALGLYLEHRFAYPSAPWAHGKAPLTAEMVAALQVEFPEIQLVPFINLLGHFEGFLYTEVGSRFAEEPFAGMQACPSNEDFVDFAHQLIEDTLHAFSSEIVHIGGDETQQLGRCSRCKAKVEGWSAKGEDGKARLYGEHFGQMAQHVLGAGRRPAVWGDMLLAHPEALAHLPKETLIYDWQYFGSCRPSTGHLQSLGFEVVCCPTLHTYNATWCHLLDSELNVRQISAEATELKAHGVCVTTWECGLFGAYDTLFPAIKASARIIDGEVESKPVPWEEPTSGFGPADSAFLHAYSDESERHEVWARLMGLELQECVGPFAFSGTRSAIKSRLLLYSNPFLLWLRHSQELSGELGEKALALLSHAIEIAPDEATSCVSRFGRGAVEFVQIVEAARGEYREGRTEACVAKLVLTRQIFDDLRKVATMNHERIGGSLADIERCDAAKAAAERAVVKVRKYGDGALGYRPSFEHLIHPKFMAHDQGAWWLINRWANE